MCYNIHTASPTQFSLKKTYSSDQNFGYCFPISLASSKSFLSRLILRLTVKLSNKTE